jgi:predicted NBD/HSP70 family sugar kinase/biotin operon repressor
MKNSPIDSKRAGQRNEQMILSLLRKSGRISQTRLCQMLSLGSSTASSIVSRLREKGLIVESCGASNRRGPKPVLLEINPQGGYCLGIEINPSYVLVGLFDYCGRLIEKRKLPLGKEHGAQQVLELLRGRLPEFTRQHDEAKILGIGLTLSGSVSSKGVVHLSSTLGWKEVPLKALFSRHFHWPVWVYGTRVRLLAEIACQPRLESRNILYLNVANGVGSTFYVNGRLVPGSTGRYGEIGHIMIDPDGPVCGCGHRGCLEAFISGPALARRIRNDIRQGRKTIMADCIDRENEDVPEEIIAQWGRAAAAADEYALEIRKFLGQMIGRAAASAINCFDPETIILAGYVGLQCPEYITGAIREAMAGQVYDYPLRNVDIVTAQSGDEALIQGAAIAVLQEIQETGR